MPLTPDQFTEICESVAEGNSLRSCLSKLQLGFTVFYNAIDGDIELEKQYARARERQAEAHHSRIMDAAQDCIDGTLDPNAARVAIDAMKWSASKLRPKIYGDNSQLALVGHDGGPLTITWQGPGGMKPAAPAIELEREREREPKRIAGS